MVGFKNISKKMPLKLIDQAE